MATYAIITKRRQVSLNVPRLLVERLDRALSLGLTGAYSRDEFARQCIEARLEAIERLYVDMRSSASGSQPVGGMNTGPRSAKR